MSKYFNIKTCPLCQGTLYLQYVDGAKTAYRCLTIVYRCLTIVSPGGDPTIKLTHYEVSVDGGMGKTIRTSIFPPYVMTTEAGTGRTQVHKWYPYALAEDNFVMEIPILLPDREPDKMVDRIKMLILFS